MHPRPLLFSLILFILLFSACAPAATPTPPPPAPTNTAAAPTDTPAPIVPTGTATIAPPAPPDNTPTAISAGADQTGCVDQASFVLDVTVPDDTKFKPGDKFTKTWRVMNTGNCRWTKSYSLVYAGGTQMGGPLAVPFGYDAAPGSPMDLSVDLTAPSADGAYTGNFQLLNAQGQAFPIDGGKYIWLKITVGTAVIVQSPASSGAGANTSTAGTGNASSGACSYTLNSVFTSSLLTLINAARAANALGPLTINGQLSSAAQDHSVDMACHSALTHSGWDGSSPKSRVSAQGYAYSYEQESIYAQPPQYGGDAAAAVDWWLNDPPHREIILSAKAKELGVGYAYVAGSALGGYFTVELAAP